MGYTESNSDVADVLYLSDLASAKAVSGAVELATTDGSKFTLTNANSNTEIQYTADGGETIAIAKVGSLSAANSFTYADEVNVYGGGSKTDTLTVSSGDATIWLDNSQGGGVTYSSIEVVNAQSTTGDVLIAGNESANTIRGGRGDASLWGGTGSAKDYVVGSTNGTTTFWYAFGEGNDTLVSSSADDVINIYSGAEGLATADIGNNAVKLGFSNGETLTVSTTKDVTFVVGDTKWTANHSSKTWTQS